MAKVKLISLVIITTLFLYSCYCYTLGTQAPSRNIETNAIAKNSITTGIGKYTLWKIYIKL